MSYENCGLHMKELWKDLTYRTKMSRAHLGQKAWNKGLKIQTNTGKTHFKKGIAHTDAWKEKMSQNVKEKIAKGTWHLPLTGFKGKDHPNWKGGGNPHKYIGHFWRTLRKKILQRDDYTCKSCGKCKPTLVSRDLCIDHIIPFRLSKSNAEDNLQVLCRICNLKKQYLDSKRFPNWKNRQ